MYSFFIHGTVDDIVAENLLPEMVKGKVFPLQTRCGPEGG